ncbi:putative nuclease HARBI1 [Leptopilina heterotoma]|uniref:putative nuclease HARBI1 n=1 Tax=Leptopilina heterotoma TaxID=63436 RepID=UPI001CA87DFB|nr:putative nuclease HARBI1 [Leptopilina heterotoma]
MTPEDFELLHRLIAHRLRKASFREPLPTKLRLALVLNLLANGDSIRTTQNFFRVGRSTIYKILDEVCSVIWEELSPWYLRNRTSREWRIIAAGFRTKWDFPNCIGALDGKEIAISAPPDTGSLFFNYKKFFSFKLLAICDAHCRFTWIEAGDCGSVSDLISFRNTDFHKAILNDELNIPPSCLLPRSNIKMPHFFIGDEIFTCQKHLMIPFARHRPLTNAQSHYNYRLSRARHTIEAAFGILTAMWQILKKPLRFHLQTSIHVVLATVCLHNFILTRRLQRGEEIDISENMNVNRGNFYIFLINPHEILQIL